MCARFRVVADISAASRLASAPDEPRASRAGKQALRLRPASSVPRLTGDAIRSKGRASQVHVGALLALAFFERTTEPAAPIGSGSPFKRAREPLHLLGRLPRVEVALGGREIGVAH